MSSTILRLGLWILILALVVYVVDTSFANSPFAGLIELDLITKIIAVAGVLVVVGIVMKMFDKTAGKVLSKGNKCRVCGVEIPAGQIYCRPHLRGMLEREDRKTHNTRIR